VNSFRSTGQNTHGSSTGYPHIQHELGNILAIASTLPEQSVTVDAGANIGLISVPVAQAVLAKGGIVHAFEIQRPLFYALCGTAALNDLRNLYVHRKGLGAAQGLVDLPIIDYGVAQDFGTISLVGRPTGDSKETVAIATIDALDLPRLDLLKIDVEGMEVDVLRGSRHMIETFEPWAWVEYWISGIAAIKEQFAGLDYKFYQMGDLNMVCVPARRMQASNIPINAMEV
jgi:FkbM family methyltransferase